MYLIDTCVISELTKRAPERRVLEWLEAVEEPFLHLSVVTIGELSKGFARLADERRRRKLRAWVEVDLRRRFEGRILPITVEVARRWGEISGISELRGARLPVLDALIAATALAHGLTVVTRNVADMERAGAPVLNPWERGVR
jgi:hypothetical protein